MIWTLNGHQKNFARELIGFPQFSPSLGAKRESREAEFALVVALYQFQCEMEARATDADS